MTLNTFFKQVGNLGIGLVALGMFSVPLLSFADTPVIPSQSVTEYLDTKKPIAQDEAKWNQFVTACKNAGGNPTSNYDTSTSKDCLAADGKTNTKCVVATTVCTATAAASTPETGSQGNAPAAFTALTQLPQIDAATNVSTLPLFLNQLYKICIGAGAALAVIMIMIGGVQIMTSKGSVTSNEKAKSHIQNAVLGLILILAPTIVFSIINPDILKLNLNVSGLQQLDSVNGSIVAGANTCTSSFSNPKAVASSAANACSTAGAGYVAAPSACCDSLAAGSACCALPKTDTTTGGFTAATITVVDAALTACGVNATDAEKSCMYSAEQSFAVNKGTAIMPHSCIPAITGRDELCVQTKLLPTSASAPGPAAQPATVTPPPTTASAANGYGWAQYLVPKGRSGPEGLAMKGPFTTSKACTDSFQTFLNDNNKDVSGTTAGPCNCNSTIASQPGCPVR